MNRHLITAFMVTVVLTGMSITAQGEVAPPPPKPECKEIVYRKWNDLLFVDNGDEKFVSYQWYKNHTAIEGATQQFYYIQGVVLEGDGNIYHVVAKCADGSEVSSCEGRFEDFSSSAILNKSKQIKHAALYTYDGFKLGEWPERPECPPVGKGCYIWLLTDDQGNVWSERAIY